MNTDDFESTNSNEDAATGAASGCLKIVAGFVAIIIGIALLVQFLKVFGPALIALFVVPAIFFGGGSSDDTYDYWNRRY